jgi:O-6-methylguanine DNA methyltransferase
MTPSEPAAVRVGRQRVRVERHDSPLGPLTLAATDNGLVRLGFSTEDEDAIFDELATKYGDTGTYRSVAVAAGSPAAVRAAGTALAKNPIPIFVPCHRVLRSDGQIGNYRGGADAKAQLLALEDAR